MNESIYYSAAASVAIRARCIHGRYRTKDMRYIISDNDVRAALPYMTPEEYETGFDIIRVSKAEAERLIAENGYQIGPPKEDEPTEEAPVETSPEQVSEPEPESTDPTEETSEAQEEENVAEDEEPQQETEQNNEEEE